MIEVIILDKDLYTESEIAPKTLGSAGLDLKLTRDAQSSLALYTAGHPYPCQDLIPTGLKVRVPTNMVGLIVPRSSSGHKDGFRLGNTLGVIDSDYRGELHISIGSGDYSKMKRGYVCAQLILVPYSSFYGAKVVDEFSDTTARGAGGFGSTDLPATTRGVLGEAKHEAGCQQIDERNNDEGV
jgi:dUTP pyrophosphatase